MKFLVGADQRWVLSLNNIHKTMRDPKSFNSGMKNSIEDLSCALSISMPPAHKVETLRSGDLRFDRLQPSDYELVGDKILEFGQFVAREAVLDEEYWVCHELNSKSESMI
ncbi:hypothetical protein K1719_018619 [Acacia pycnantha]|nr:hypothetical protein K1719_018619 [Acacia pycnantha]